MRLRDPLDVVALVPSCALMLKFEWPLILPDEAKIKRLANATFDVSEYVVDIAKREGLAPGLQPLDGGVALHIACQLFYIQGSFHFYQIFFSRSLEKPGQRRHTIQFEVSFHISNAFHNVWDDAGYFGVGSS